VTVIIDKMLIGIKKITTGVLHDETTFNVCTHSVWLASWGAFFDSGAHSWLINN